MADKNKKDKKQPRGEDTAEHITVDQSPSDARRFGESRRRLPLAALVVLLALIGVGVYFAWPAIEDSVQTAPPEEVTASAEPEPAVEPVPALAAPPEPSPALTALSEQVAALESALTAQSAALKRAEAALAAATALPPEPDLTPVADAMARLEDMEKRLSDSQAAAQAAAAAAATANGEAGVSAGAIDFQTLERLEALERGIASIETDTAAAEIDELRAELTGLREQIAALSQSSETMDLREVESGRTMLLVLSYTRLSRAAAGPAPFAREAEAFAAAARAEGEPGIAFDNALAQLAAHALGGTPTHAELVARFDQVALAVVQADVEAEDQGWVDATIGRLRRIVTVRRVGGDIAADSLEGRLSALHLALSGGDLAGAVTLADALPAKSRRGAEDWLRDARARLAVEQALGVLEAEITERVAARWSPEARSGE